MSTLDSILAALLTLAIIAVLVSSGSKTATAISDATGALTSAIATIMSPLMTTGG